MSRDKARYQDYQDDEEEYYRPRVRSRRPQPRSRPRKKQRVWPWLLVGCAGGIVLVVLAAAVTVFLALRSATNGGLGTIGSASNLSTYTQQNQQQVPISPITQLQVHNKIGDVTITVDPNTTMPTVTTLKKVKAASSDDANKEFGNISVQVQPANTPATTLAVSATVPDTGTILGNHNDSVDITITLPPSVNNSSSSPLMLNANSPVENMTSIGNVLIDGLNGILDVKDDIGNVTVQNATLVDSSCLATSTGKITFNGSLNTTTRANFQLCSSNPPSAGSTSQAAYKIHSEVGDVDVTLHGNPDVTVNATTNVGTITSDFNINVTKNTDGTVSYDGPFNPNTTSQQPSARLILDVSTGDVHLHKA